MAKRKRRRRRRGGGGLFGGGGPGISSARDKVYLFAGAAAYGYAANHIDFFENLPVIDALGKPLSHAIALHFLARNTSGQIRVWSDRAAVGAVCIAGNALGSAKFDFKALEEMKGGDMMGHGVIGGHIDGDEDDIDDDDEEEFLGDDDDDDDDAGDADGDDEND